MTPDPSGAWQAAVASPLSGLTLTVGAYVGARALWERLRRPALLNPVLVAIAVVVAVLLATGTSYDDYLRGGGLVSFLLGPATVALAVPLHRQARHVRAAAVPLLAGLVCGTTAAVLSALVVTRLLGGDAELAVTTAPVTVTTPVAIAVSSRAGGLAPLTAVSVIVVGVLGAVAAPALLARLRITDRRAAGLAIGGSSHGIGTARALHDDARTGAFASLGMAVNTVVMSLLVPLLVLLPGLVR